MSATSRYLYYLNTVRGGLVIFALLAIATTGAIAYPPTGFTTSLQEPPAANGSVSVSSAISQHTFVQGGPGSAFLTLTIDTPVLARAMTDRAPVDMVVVLDRSGSMSDSQKLPLAKRAIKDLIDQLSSEDRFALVSFDSTALVEFPLTEVTNSMRGSILDAVERLTPGGSTNISAGMDIARELLCASTSPRTRRVLLLSDGEANAGIQDPQQLGELARDFSNHNVPFSTIGLGLGFNESLLSLMADFGMGNYSYLENVEGLTHVLAQNLNEARAAFATSSAVELFLADGVELRDAAGYPVERNGSRVLIPTGELLYGARKHIRLSFDLPTNTVRSDSIGKIHFRYTHDAEKVEHKLPSSALAFSIVPQERQGEAVASVNEEVLRESWRLNNFGAMQRRVQGFLKLREYDKAKAAVSDYEAALKTAEKLTGTTIGDSKHSSSIKALSTKLDAAIAAPAVERDERINRLAKEQLTEGLQNQRK